MKTILTFLISFCFVALSFGQTRTAGDFRTISNGDWNDIAIWETEFFGWGPALSPPSYTLNPGATYTVNHDLTLGVGLILDINGADLVISIGGSITVPSTSSIDASTGTITNSAGNSGLIIESDASGTGSLISNSSPDGTLECYVTKGAWHLIGPVHNTSANPLFFDGYMQSWVNPALGGSWEVQDPDTPGSPDYSMTRGYGDAFYFIPSDFTAEMAGALNGAALPLSSLTNSTTDLGNAADGYYCLANPFPCAVDLSLCTSSNLIGDFHDFQIYTGLDYETTDGLGSTIIGPSQGFFVQVANSSTGSFTFPTSAKTSDIQSLYKSSDSELIKFRLADPIGKTNSPLLIRINDEATFDFDDSYDVINMVGASTCGEITVNYAENFDLSVLGIPSVDNEYSVDLNFKKGESNEYSFRLASSDISNLEVSIVDNLSGHSFIFTEDNANYDFTADENMESRFTLTFKSATGISNPTDIDMLRIWSFDDKVYVSQDAPMNGDINIYDVSGKLVYTSIIQKSSLQKIDIGSLTQGVYMVKIYQGNQSYSQKIIK